MTEYTSPLLLMETCPWGRSSNSDVTISQPSNRKPLESTRITQWGRVSCTEDPCSTMRVRRAQGKPRPSRMSKMLLPMELDTAMSPIPEGRQQRFRSQVKNLCQNEPPIGNTSIHLPLKGGTKTGSEPQTFIYSPCRATIRLAMQSGTLVPAARKVMPMM